MQRAKFEAFSWAFALVAVLGCGGSSNSSSGGKPSAAEVKDLCGKVCQKLVTCQSLPLDCTGFCAENGPGTAAIPPACYTRDAFNGVAACVDGECAAFESCLTSATDSCSNGTGGSTSTGGSGSTGGSTSTGGSGSADCSVCNKASACCMAVATQTGQDASQCAALSASTCTSAGAQQSVLINACQMVLQSAASLNLAACK